MMSNYSSILSSLLLCVLAASTFTSVVNGQTSCSTSNNGDEPTDTIYFEVCKDADLSILCGLLKSTELDSDLSQNELLTLFAPVNSAFTGAPKNLIGFDTKQLKKTLKYHVISGDLDTSSGVDDAGKLSCTSPTSTKLGGLTSQTQCSFGDTQTRDGQLGNTLFFAKLCRFADPLLNSKVTV